jgi:hypothetical protein
VSRSRTIAVWGRARSVKTS